MSSSIADASLKCKLLARVSDEILEVMPSQLLKKPVSNGGFIYIIKEKCMSYKYIGTLKEEIAEYWKISEHKNKPILIYTDRKQHVIENHLKDFNSLEEIENIFNNLNIVIKNPDYVYYNSKTKGLEYYKKMDSDICVAVRINSGKVLKVKSFYPVKMSKIENRKKKEEQQFLNKVNN